MTNTHGNRHVVVTSIERAPLDAGLWLELSPE